MKSVAVYCGSSTGHSPIFSNATKKLGTALAEHNISLVYGGGKNGLMGVIAQAVMANKGEVTGIITQRLMNLEVGNTDISKLQIVDGMHERKALMMALSDAFIVLPGGIGTMEEFFEVFTWLQLGYHRKPIILFNINGYYDKLYALLLDMQVEGFLGKKQFNTLKIVEKTEAIIDFLLHYDRNDGSI